MVQKQVFFWLENGRRDGQGGLSQKTVRDLVTILKMCLHDYEKQHNVPLSHIEIQYPSVNQKKEIEILSQDQQKWIMERIQNDGRYETLGYAVSLYTGIRIGELCALKWTDIDMEKRMITIDKTIQRIYLKNGKKKGNTKIIITAPKSVKAIRKIPISQTLYNLLKAKSDGEHDRYFLTGTKKFIEPRLYRKHYKKFLEQNRIDYIRFHGLRHTFATRCVEAGANYKVVSELLGHSSVNLTMNLYVHPQWEEKQKCVELI